MFQIKSPLVVSSSYSRDNKINIWTEDGSYGRGVKFIRTIDFKDSQINSLAISENFLAVAGFNTVEVCDMTSDYRAKPQKEQFQELPWHQHPEFSSLAEKEIGEKNRHLKGNEMKAIFSNDGKTIFSCNERGTVTCWSFDINEIPSFDMQKQIDFERPVNYIAKHPTEEFLAIAVKIGSIFFWDHKISLIPKLFAKIRESPVCIEFSDDGRRFAALSSKGSVWIWGISSPLKYHLEKEFAFISRDLQFTTSLYALKLKFSNDQKLLAISGSHGLLKVYSTDDFQLLYEHIPPQLNFEKAWIWDLQFSWDNNFIYFGSSVDGCVRKWKFNSGTKKAIYDKIFHVDNVKSITAIAVYDKV